MAEKSITATEPSSTEDSPKQPPTRERIIALALEYLREVGPVAFETKELANRGGFTQSQVNYHFGSRDGLLVEVMTRLLVDHIEENTAKVEAHDDPMDGLMAWVDTVIEFVIDWGPTATLVSSPDLFSSPTNVEPWRKQGAASEVLDASERSSTVLFSALYAIQRGRKYKRVNRAKMAAIAVTNQRVTNAVVIIGMATGGFGRVWSQHLERPIFGFDPRKLLRRSVEQVANDLKKNPAPEVNETEYFD